MGFITEQDLKQELKSNSLGGLYLLFGEESYLVRHYAGAIVKKAVEPAFADFNFHNFDGRECTVRSITDAAEVYPMMAQRSCVAVNDMPLDTLAQAELDELFAFAAEPPEHCVTVFSLSGIEVDAKKNAKWKKIVEKFAVGGKVLNLEKRSTRVLSDTLCRGAAKRGCELDAAAAEYIITLAGDDLNTLLNETDKLCAFVGTGKITREHIDSVVVKTLEARVFDLAKFLVSGNYEKAYELLNTLFQMKTEPVSILSTLVAAYVDMYRARAALDSGEKSDAAAKLFNYKNKEFRLRNAARDIGNMSVPALRACLDELDRADTLLKSTSADSRIVLEKLLVKLVLLRNESR